LKKQKLNNNNLVYTWQIPGTSCQYFKVNSNFIVLLKGLKSPKNLWISPYNVSDIIAALQGGWKRSSFILNKAHPSSSIVDWSVH